MTASAETGPAANAAPGPVVHFVQCCDAPVFSGGGPGVLDCACGNRLVDRYDPAYFIDIGLQCGHCGAVTTTPPLADAARPPFAVVIAEPVAERRMVTAVLGPSAFVISRAEMDRLNALYQPRTPDWLYHVTPALLDRTEETYQQVTGGALPDVAASPGDFYAGMAAHPLAWSVAHLRDQMRQDPWRADDGIPTPVAIQTVTGFLHFTASWAHHPLFPAMVAGAATHGFGVHGLVPFAAAHCAAMMGNRIAFPAPQGNPPQITGFTLTTGPTDTVQIVLDLFTRFEVPFGQPWTPALLRSTVADRIAASAARINPRNHGILLLSPGSAMSGFDDALMAAVRDVMQSQGRRHRGLMAVAPMVLRLQQMQDPHTVRLCYGFLPVENRHYEGDTDLRAGT